MSVANRYKVLTLSGTQCFALLRAMANREAYLVDQIDSWDKESTPVLMYMQQQLDDLRQARAAFNSNPFVDGRPS